MLYFFFLVVIYLTYLFLFLNQLLDFVQKLLFLLWIVLFVVLDWFDLV